MRRAQTAAVCAAIALACLWAIATIATPAAHAAIPGVFTASGTPVACAVQSNGVRLCDEAASVPARPRSTVPSFDDVPIDVRVAVPPASASGPDGPYPLIMMFHRWGGNKATLGDMEPWLGRGYATFSMTDRGFGESCGTAAARQASADCTAGYIRMMDTRYEVRDAQELAGALVDDEVVDPQRIGAIGRSYGGATAIALAALKDRVMRPDGSLVPWRSPLGASLRIAAAAPETTWTDLMASRVPNGTTLDYAADAPYVGRTGVSKQSWDDTLYGIGAAYFYAPVGQDPAADLPGWHTLLGAGEPYDDANGHPRPPAQYLRDQLTTYHSAYYIDHSEPPAPVMMSSGWTDDLAPADEAVRFYNRVRT